MKVLIIGGVAAGTKAAAKLKREDRSLDITILTRDRDISYAGCGLPYYVGGLIEPRDQLIVNTPEKYAALTGVQVRTGREAVGLLHRRILTGQNGDMARASGVIKLSLSTRIVERQSVASK